MEKLTNIRDNINERLSSPLIFSFVISWIFINWRVTTALLWYDPPKQSLGHLSLIEYMESQITTLSGVILPFVFAIAYTILSPVVKNGITAFYTWAAAWGDSWNLRISKGSKVSMDRYLSLRDNLSKKTKQLEEIIDRENLTKNDLDLTTSTLLSERQEFKNLQREYSEVKRIVDNLYQPNFIQGQWIKTSVKESGEKQEAQRIQFMNSSVFIRIGNASQRQYQMHHFVFDIARLKMQFILFEVDANSNQSNQYQLCDLTYHTQDYLEGWEYSIDGRFQVEYKKPKA
jgi:hypothetical protein